MDGNLPAIQTRYDGLAESACCLSCGGAANHGDAQPGEVCLDLGSGRGQDVLRLAEAVGPEGLALGIDASEGMLDKARRNAEKLGVTNVRFLQSELEHLKLPGGLVDLVVSNCTINHAADKDAVWGEVFRVLKGGGRFVVSDIYAIEDVPEAYRDDPQAVAECWAGAVRRDAYLDTLARTGFEDVRVIEESAPYDKGKIRVASFTVAGRKPAGCGGCCCDAGEGCS